MANEKVPENRIDWQAACRQLCEHAAKGLQDAERALDHSAGALGEAAPGPAEQGEDLLKAAQAVYSAYEHGSTALASALAIAGALEQMGHLAEQVAS